MRSSISGMASVLAAMTVLAACGGGSDETAAFGQDGESVDGQSLDYRVLSAGTSTSPANTTVVVSSASDYEDMDDQPDGVDFVTEVVVVFNFAESASCDVGEITDVVFDSDFDLMHPLTTTAYESSQNTDCGADVSTRQVLVAVTRESLPEGAFSISMFAGDAPGETMSKVAAKELSINDDGIAAIGKDGELPVGETRIAYDVYTHCGVGYLSFGEDPLLWKAESGAGQLDYMPSGWVDLVEEQYIDLRVERVAEDQLEIVAVGADEVLTYTPTDDEYECL